MKMNFLISFFLLIVFLLLNASGFAGKRYWRGNGSNTNWNSTGNWSATLTGATGSSVPGSSDSAYFDSTGVGQCVINATVSIKHLKITSYFIDTIKQGSFAITIGTSGVILNGGTFWGGTASVTDQGIFTLSGGTFKSTSGTLTIQKDYTFSSGTFSHNNGTLLFTGVFNITGNTTLYKCSFLPLTGVGGTFTIDTSTVITVNDKLTCGDVVLKKGTVDAQGDIAQTGTNSTSSTGTGVIRINGIGTQTFTGQPATRSSHGAISWIKIDKTNGTLFIKDTIVIRGKWEYISGTVDMANFICALSFPINGSTFPNTIKGTQSISNLVISGSAGSANTLTINSGDTLTVSGNILTSGTSDAKINGYINLHGNITINNTANVSTSAGGTGTITVNGSGKQTITGSASIGQGRLCNIKINKSSDTLILKNIVNLSGDWTYVAGIIDASTYTSTVAFCFSTGRTISGKHSLYNVSFYAPNSCTNTISSTDTLTVNGTLTTEGSSVIALNTGVICLKGDCTLNNTSTSTSSGGTATLYFNGPGDHTFTGSSTLFASKLCNVKINKSGGTLSLDNIITLADNSSWKLVNGVIDPGKSTVIFTRGTKSIEGKQSFYNLTFEATSSASTVTLISTDTITVTNELKFSGTSANTINTGVINAEGDITITNTGGALGGGSATINICGVGSQFLTGNGIVIAGCLPNVKVNKSTGTLQFASIFSLASTSTWKYIQGYVDPGTSTFAIISGGDVDCDNGSAFMKFNNFTVQGGSTAATLSGMLRLNGNLKIDAARTLNTNSYNIEVGGNFMILGTLTFGTSKITFNGYNNQYITNPATGTLSLYDVELNKPSGKLYLQGPNLQVNHQLTLTEGIISSTSSKTLFLIDNATVSGGSDSSYVNGPVKKTGNDIFTFPLGDTVLTSGAYHPLSITIPSSSTDAFTATYYSANQTAGTTKVDSIDLSTCEYWTIARNVGSSNVKTTLGWNTNNCLSSNAYDMVVSGWDGTNSIWKSLENTNITISGSTGSVTASATPFWNSTNAVNVMIAKKKSITTTEHVREPYCFPGATRGFVHIGVTFGAPPYTYAWSNSATTQDIDSLTAGTYSLTITDRYSRTFTRNYTLENCTNWSTLPSGLSSDTTGQLHKSSGDTTWLAGQSVLIIDSLETGRWIKFTIADTASKFLIGFGPVAVDSVEEETNLMMFLEGSQLTVIETDNDGFYSKEVIGTIAVNDILKVELSETDGILYYKNDVLIHNGKLLSNARLQLTANLYGSNKNIKKIRCSSNN
jgi:hypothetical protein